MANEKRLIDANALQLEPDPWGGMNGVIWLGRSGGKTMATAQEALKRMIDNAPTVDAVEVVRCQNCVHAEPLDRNCELSTTHYLHCKLWRGEETKNVWHKYKKYYKDYSLVERDGYCDAGAKMDGGNEDV